MNRWASGAIALSCLATRYQEGMAFHPAAVAFSVRAATASGRWVAYMTWAKSTGTSAQKVSRNWPSPMNRSGPSLAPSAS